MQNLLICFDVDGTLIDDTVFIWETLHQRIRTDPAERKHWADEYWKGKITYAEWATRDVEMWRKKNIRRDQMLDIIRHLRPMAGAVETLTTLKRQADILSVISGSLDIALELALGNVRRYFDYIMLNRLLFDEQGYLTGVTPTPFDIEHKATGLKSIALETAFPLNRTVFVGDNFNDVEVSKIAGLSIAFNCKSDELACVADHVVPGSDLRAILPIIEEYRAGIV
ncbi:HAD-IB family phosphatase [bacterium]|nr:HAD-IB family phosphatase [candidate division CSSED10-310 bacterium]